MDDKQIQIPKGWKKKSLGEVLKYEQPYNYIVSSTNYDEKSGIPVLTAGKSFILGYTEEAQDVYADYPVIIFDDFTTDSKYVDFSFKVKSSAMKFLKERNNKEINLKFIFAIIQELKYSAGGSDHKRRWISEFSKIEIGIPPIQEQTKIANIISEVNDAISKTENLIAKFQKVKIGLMQDLLTKGIDANGNIRNKSNHRFTLKNGIEIPEEWEVERLGDVCSKIQDGTHFSPKTSDDGEFMYLTSKNIRLGYLDLSNVEFIDRNQHEDIYKSCPVKVGDVMLTKDGANTGNVAINNITEQFSLLSSVCILRGKSGVLHNNYLLNLLLSENGQRLIKDSMSGLAITRITLNVINNFVFPLPPLDEQIRISDKIDQLEKYIGTLRRDLIKFQSLRTGLMQDLLSGKVRV